MRDGREGRSQAAMTPTQKSGHARLMLRLPNWRSALSEISGQSFFDICEAYNRACDRLAHWIRSEDPLRGERIVEYQEQVTTLEFEAMMIVITANKSRETG